MTATSSSKTAAINVISGTSAASPSFAGVMALAVETKGGLGQGNANPSLYALLNTSKTPFHATPSGNNSVPGVTGFTASGASYNLATGLGSVDGSVLVDEWGTGSSTTTLTLNAASASLAVVQGASSTVSLTVQTGGSFSGMIGYSVSGLPTDVTAKWSANPATPPASVSTNSETLTLTASATAPLSLATVVVTVAGDGLNTSKNLTLQVWPTPGVLMTVSPQTLSMPSLSTATVTVTAVSVGGAVLVSSTGSSTISIASGLPKGLTAKWGTPGVTSAGAVFRTLTLTGSTSAIAGTSILGLAGAFTSKTGSVYKTDVNLPLMVTVSVAKRLHARPLQTLPSK